MADDPTRIDIDEEERVIIEHQGEDWVIFVDDFGNLKILRPERFGNSEPVQEGLERELERLKARVHDLTDEST